MTKASNTTKASSLLTQKGIEAMPPQREAYRVPDQRAKGLAVRVATNGVKTWDLAFRITGTGQFRRMSLGKVSDVSLEAARRRSNEITSAARAGRDLVEEEVRHAESERARVSVRQLVEAYVKRRVRGRLRTASEIESRLYRALGPILSKHAADIRRRDLRELFDAAFDNGLRREAEKRRQTVGAMFRWAVSQDIIDVDPAHGLVAYESGAPRDRVLSWDEIVLLWNWLGAPSLPLAPPTILRLQILLGARCSEIGGMRAEEINTTNWLWTLPAARSKNNRPRVTPLVGRARQIVSNALTENSAGPLFSTERRRPFTSANVGQFLLSRRGSVPVSGFSTHDLRRTFATRLIELGVGSDIVAATIGHSAASGEATRTLLRHYVWTDQVERKRQVLAYWDRIVGDIILGGPPPTASTEEFSQGPQVRG
ncbi:tyrosine-type recombinase/integrase [Devosia sp. 67-54]|uniref:tyrosine-type recombinase/integrase n=1 Tax=unclassified Devosia TaxID=196773 RepID=UPI001AC97996|nr:tyrosine-type recombinase/integrase [Devosia sp.]